MSPDWASASALTRSLTSGSRVATSPRALMPDPVGVRERGHRLAGRDQRLGRHAVGEHAHAPDAVPVDEGHLGLELGGDERRLVAGRAAADDRDPGHPTIVADRPRRASHARDRPSPRLCGMALYAAYGSNLDPTQMKQRCPHSPALGTGWIEGWRLTFGAEELGWEGALATARRVARRARLRRPVRPHRPRRAGPRRLGGRRHRALPQDQRPRPHPRRRDARLGLRARRLRGRPALRALPRRAGPGRRGRRRAGRLRPRPAHPAVPLAGVLSRLDAMGGRRVNPHPSRSPPTSSGDSSGPLTPAGLPRRPRGKSTGPLTSAGLLRRHRGNSSGPLTPAGHPRRHRGTSSGPSRSPPTRSGEVQWAPDPSRPPPTTWGTSARPPTPAGLPRRHRGTSTGPLTPADHPRRDGGTSAGRRPRPAQRRSAHGCRAPVCAGARRGAGR